MHRPGAAGEFLPRSHLASRGPLGADFIPLHAIGLTPRQCEVLEWIAHGKRDADIAKILGIATKTVGKHVEHLLAKLHAENRTAAVRLACERLRDLHTLPGRAKSQK